MPTPLPLPLSLSRFIGRERELRWAKDLLAKRRFVTLLGPGGLGKTRLALQLAGVAQRRGRFMRAAQLFGAAATIAESIGYPLLPEHRGLNTAQDLTTLCTQMTTAEFEAAWEMGRALPEEQALKYALE